MQTTDDSDAWVHPTLKRFLAFEFTPHFLRGRYALWLKVILASGAILLWNKQSGSTGGLFTNTWVLSAFLIIGILGLVYVRYESKALHKWVLQAVPVKAVLVMANSNLFQRGDRDAPCLVLFSLQSGYTSNLSFLTDLATRIYALRGTEPTDPDLKEVALIAEDEGFFPNRRRLLPSSFTGGPQVYVADLFLERRLLWKRKLTSNVIHCLVDPNEKGRMETIPWQVVTGL